MFPFDDVIMRNPSNSTENLCSSYVVFFSSNGTSEDNSTELALVDAFGTQTNLSHKQAKSKRVLDKRRHSYKTFNFTSYYKDVVYQKLENGKIQKMKAYNAQRAAEQRARQFRERQQQENFYKNRVKKVNDFPYKFVHESLLLCHHVPEILVLVNSRHASYDKRSAIRDTWGKAIKSMKWFEKNLTSKIAIAFVLGIPGHNRTGLEAIQQESDVFHDIILGDFIDDYSNMTLKSLLAMKWASVYCGGARHFVKSDDDMFINIPHLSNILKRSNFKRSIMGPHCPASAVMRYGKWAVPEKAYPFSRYPPYEAGSAYVISMDIVRPLFDASFYFTHFSIDDAFITGVLAKFIGANHARKGGFSYEGTRLPTTCDIVSNRRVTGHGFSAVELRKFWNALSVYNRTRCR